MFLLLSLVLVAGSALRVDAILQDGSEGVCTQIRTEPHTDYETREYSETRKEWCWDIAKAFRCNVIYPRWEQVPVTREREVKFLVCCDGWWFVDGFCKRQHPVHEEVPIVVVPEESPVDEKAPSDEHVHEEDPIIVSLPEETPAPAVEEHQDVPIVAVPEDTPTVEEVTHVEEEPRHVEEIPSVVAPEKTSTGKVAPTAPDTEVNMTDLELARALFRALNRDSHPPVDEAPVVHPSKPTVFEEFIDTPEEAGPTAEAEFAPVHSESDESEFPIEEIERHLRDFLKHIDMTPVEQRVQEGSVETANEADQQHHGGLEKPAPIEEHFEQHWRELIKHIATAPVEHRAQENSEANDQHEEPAAPAHHERKPEPHWKEIIKHIVANRPVVHQEEAEQPAAAAAHAAEEAAAAEAAHRAHEDAKAEQMAAEIAGIFVKELINALPQEAVAPTSPEPSVEHGLESTSDHTDVEPEPLAPSLPEVQKVLEDTMADLSETMLRSLSRLHRAWASIHPQHSGTHDRLETRA